MSTGSADELAEEREHLAASRAALGRMRDRTRALHATGEKVAGDAYAAETLGTALSRRIDELADHPSTPLFFGKLSFDNGEVHYIGRRHVTDDLGEPMVLDWRAPISGAFYQASVGDPRGVMVRRRFGFAGAGTDRAEVRLTSFEDEHLDRGQELGTDSAILTAEIERPRVGPMRDIVATIQPEQDALVRAGLSDSICVQGAPGTGKTAVGLHRAAYLLYVHRERLRRSGVLVVGPNRAFLRYIEAVLPALGEVEVQQSTIEDLIARVPVRATDAPEVSRLKHDPRLATVLHHALWQRVREPTVPVMVADGSHRWRISTDTLTKIIEDVRADALPYLAGRERVRARVVALLRRQSEVRRADSPSDGWSRRMARSKPVTAFLDAAWPVQTPQALVFRLFTDAEALAAAADGVLDQDEQRLLRWQPSPRSARTARWTAADALLVDEAAGLLERQDSVGHLVVDEAQDLSPMQARALARRSQHASLTLLGDLAQGTAPWATRDWRDTLTHIGKPDAAVVPLTTGFRVPAAVLALANRLLPALAVDVPEAVSLRRDGHLGVHQVSEIVESAVTWTRQALAHEGSVGVIVPDPMADRLRTALVTAGIEPGDPGEPDHVSLVPASVAKGLEFDHVIVVEPAAIVAGEPSGLHRLYVALTRAVSRLTVVHAAALPAEMASPPPDSRADAGAPAQSG